MVVLFNYPGFLQRAIHCPCLFAGASVNFTACSIVLTNNHKLQSGCLTSILFFDAATSNNIIVKFSPPTLQHKLFVCTY